MGCIAGVPPQPTVPVTSRVERPEPEKFDVKQPFPDEARLKQITSKPAADPSVSLGEAPATVDRWSLAGPLPSSAGRIAFTSDDPERTRAAAIIANQRDGFQATAGMMCFAHEYARFVATHDRPPPVDIQMFISGRCGTTVTQWNVRTMKGSKIRPDRVLADRGKLAELFGDMPNGSQVGIGWDEGESQRVIVIAAGRPDVEIEPVRLDGVPKASVVIRGKVLWPIEWLNAHVTRGELGYERCETLTEASGPNGEFGVECSVDPKDPLAFIEIVAAQRGSLMGRAVLTLGVSPDGSAPHDYVVSMQPLPVDDGDRRPEALVAGINAVRDRAKVEPLRLSPEQSTVAQNLFEHLQGQDDVAVKNEIALGIMAGWQVEGTIREGGFKVAPANREWPLARLLAGSLASPSFRSVALDPDADIVAVGQLESTRSGARSVLWATYDMFEPKDFGEEEAILLGELDAQRAALGLDAVARMDGRQDREALEASARRIRNHEASPPDELQAVLNHFASTIRGRVQGMVLAPMRLDGWRPEFPEALLKAEHVAVATKISYFKPEGAAWGQHVVLLVFTELDSRPR